MPSSKNKDLLLAEKLNEEGKYEDAFKIIVDLEQNGELTLFERISCNLIKGSVMVMLGRYNEVLNLAEQILHESQKLGKRLQVVDALILKCKALYWLRRLDESFEIIDKCERLLETQNNESLLEIKQRKAWIAWGKGLFYKDKGESELQLKYLEQGLVLGEETGSKEIIFKCLMLIGAYYTFIGEFDQALSYITRSLEVANLMQNQIIIAWNFCNLAFIHYEKGELDNSIKYEKKAYQLFKKTKNELHMSITLNNLGFIYMQKGEIPRALRYYERSLIINEEIGDPNSICIVLDSLISLTLEERDFKQAYLYFNRLKKIKNEEGNQKLVNLLYRFDKALILKKDPQISNLDKAKTLLEQIINEEVLHFHVYIIALLELCDILLIDLKDTNDLKLIDIIKQYINKIIENAKRIHSYWLLAEIYLLQAKLELITLDLNETQRSLTKAHKIAEKHGLNLLCTRILNEKDELQEQFSIWENFKNSKTIISDRIELAHIDEQLIQLLRKRVSLEKVSF